jgi:hypothetical protein
MSTVAIELKLEEPIPGKVWRCTASGYKAHAGGKTVNEALCRCQDMVMEQVVESSMRTQETVPHEVTFVLTYNGITSRIEIGMGDFMERRMGR